jgi:ketopantoate reductase
VSVVLQFFEKTSPGGRSSMQKDVAAGNPPELDAIAGPILRGGQTYRIDVPATRELAAMIEIRRSPKVGGGWVELY